MSGRLRHDVYYIKERKYNLRTITMYLKIYDRVAATCFLPKCDFLTFLVLTFIGLSRHGAGFDTRHYAHVVGQYEITDGSTT